MAKKILLFTVPGARYSTSNGGFYGVVRCRDYKLEFGCCNQCTPNTKDSYPLWAAIC